MSAPKIRTVNFHLVQKNNKFRLHLGNLAINEKPFGVKVDYFRVDGTIDDSDPMVKTLLTEGNTKVKFIQSDGDVVDWNWDQIPIDDDPSAQPAELDEKNLYFVDNDNKLCYLLNQSNAKFIWIRAKEASSTLNFYTDQINSLGVAYFNKGEDCWECKDFSEDLPEIRDWVTDIEIEILHFHSMFNQTEDAIVQAAFSPIQVDGPVPKKGDIYIYSTNPYLLYLTVYLRES